MARSPQVSFTTPKHNTASPGKASKLGGTNHGHSILARLALVPRDNVVNNGAIEAFSVLVVVSVECNNWVGNPEGHGRNQADCY